MTDFLFFEESRARRKEGPDGRLSRKKNPHLSDSLYTIALLSLHDETTAIK